MLAGEERKSSYLTVKFCLMSGGVCLHVFSCSRTATAGRRCCCSGGPEVRGTTATRLGWSTLEASPETLQDPLLTPRDRRSCRLGDGGSGCYAASSGCCRPPFESCRGDPATAAGREEHHGKWSPDGSRPTSVQPAGGGVVCRELGGHWRAQTGRREGEDRGRRSPPRLPESRDH